MESIGTHAAVALENARHFSEMASALTRLDQAHRQNLINVQALEELSTVDRRLMCGDSGARGRWRAPKILRVLLSRNARRSTRGFEGRRALRW
ncbi:hypothetical protein J2S89_002550 [Arthrobacter bambusae]|nr:hypothetical protein [Arthrobacter bambusae]MDQ0098997.1 hypothetical protein [Arthrobacter bambusae]